ncbi:MAG: tetratricopeptide repeat protein [Verrucomicrobiaceae bacterium]|nr:MAG: tetratricopeptide repeat protein [Verrucomicrobiaceae bacterium]
MTLSGLWIGYGAITVMKPPALTPCFPATPVRLRRLACGLWLFAAAAAASGAPDTPAGTTPAPASSVPVQSTAPSKRPLPEAMKSALQSGLFEEEANRDYDKAIAAYREALDLYDAQRPTAGTVLYRLAECLRKKGQPAEAIPLYRRVLAEFKSDTGLVSDAQRRLTELDAGTGPAPAETPSFVSQEETNILSDLRVLAERNPEMLPSRAASYFIPAVKQKQLEVLKFFVEHRVKDLDLDSAIRIAAGMGSLPMVRILLGATPEPRDLTESLRLAANNGDVPLMDFLLQHEVDVKKHGAPALMAALVYSNTAAFYKLIDAGVDLNTAVDFSDNIFEADVFSNGRLRPLAWALDKGDEPLARYLVEKGARCDLPSESNGSAGIYPLHKAWNADLARFLLEHGADREARDPEGGTPVLTAAGSGLFDVVEALATAGADLKATDKQGRTLINHLVSGISNHPAFTDPAKLPQEFHGSSKPLRKDDPRIPELRAAAVRVLDVAVKAGVPINGVPSAVRENAELHPLASACRWAESPAQAEFVEQMIKRSADVNFADVNGVTPLHSAALLRSLPLVGVLLRHGANPLAETTTALSVISPSQPDAYILRPLEDTRRVMPAVNSETVSPQTTFFRYRPMDLVGVRKGALRNKDTILLLARATYAHDFKNRETGVWQECSVLFPTLSSTSFPPGPLRKIADPAWDGETPVGLLEAVLRANPGLSANAAPEIHILRHAGNENQGAEDIMYDLSVLTTDNPPAFPALQQGDVILMLPRSA